MLRAGALYSYTNGSQSRRRMKREDRAEALLARAPAGLTAKALQQQLCQTLFVPPRTVQRTLSFLVKNGRASRTTRATSTGIEVIYRVVSR
jgi:hypothetical protein